jgi:hypothetical protein
VRGNLFADNSAPNAPPRIFRTMKLPGNNTFAGNQSLPDQATRVTWVSSRRRKKLSNNIFWDNSIDPACSTST